MKKDRRNDTQVGIDGEIEARTPPTEDEAEPEAVSA